MSDENERKELASSAGSKVPTQVNLSPTTTMDLSWLPEAERKALLVDYTKSMLNISKKAQELHVDSEILKKTLSDLSDATAQVSAAGDSVTISHTQSTSVGRTEVLMGNTDKAQSGKLTKSQTGEKDMTAYYIFGGIVALIIIVAISSS